MTPRQPVEGPRLSGEELKAARQRALDATRRVCGLEMPPGLDQLLECWQLAIGLEWFWRGRFADVMDTPLITKSDGSVAIHPFATIYMASLDLKAKVGVWAIEAERSSPR